MWWTPIVLLVGLVTGGCQAQTEEERARTWLKSYNNQAQIVWSMSVEADWEYNTNLTDYNLEKSVSKF